MAYFPFMVEIGEKNCLVVGGGRVAFHKVKVLLDFGVRIKVVAANIGVEMRELISGMRADNNFTVCCGNIECIERGFQECDINGMDFVIVATNNDTLNYHIANLCKQKNIPVNVVDMKEACTFIFPAVIKEQDLLIAISSGGQSPMAAAYVKQKLKKQIPDYYGDMITALGQYRDYILECVDTAEERKKVFHKLLEYGDTHEGIVPKGKVQEVISDITSRMPEV